MDIKKDYVIKNSQGLHARPAAMFVQIVSKHNSEVTLIKDDERVNGKSIMGILTLGLQKDAKVTIEISGDDAEKVMMEIEELINKDEI